MSPKKKTNKQDNQTVKPVLVHENSAKISKTQLNGHSVNHSCSVVQEAQQDVVIESPTVVNGCNGNHASDSSESSTSNLQVSSPEKVCSETKQSESVEVLGASLNLIKISNDSLEQTVLLSSVLDDGSETQTDRASSSISPAKMFEKVTYVQYQSELQMPDIMRLIQKDLSEPYSIYTYRYFIHNWPMLCFLVR